ncbi:deoxyribonuclease-1 [Acanthochromis polyacanthus]|uniref:Deoxyribonuclease n=1 Tax=Acanthochromis polyacanthus TaxID=80966 RepID=A0A3Q1FMA3_9TELE|nr:deoxyribonuclease-1 [Acanthochromis polyacanthus]
MRLLCSLGLVLALLHVSTSLLLGAFNIKTFGDTKASNTTLMSIINTIVQRYDILLIQEVRDSDLSATKKLMELVNRNGPEFGYTVSEPLGRSTYTERYLFLYRLKTVSVVKSYHYDDGCEPCGTDTFNREPFVVMFTSPYTVVKNFVLIPQHTSPDSAVEEVQALYDVVVDVRQRLNTNDIVLLGDFNAGCSYVSGSDWQKIQIFTDKSFHWLIPNDADTTVGHTECPYDRIVVTTDMMKGVVPHSAQVYDYMTDLKLSHSLASAVSDHYPVEVTLAD